MLPQENHPNVTNTIIAFARLYTSTSGRQYRHLRFLVALQQINLVSECNLLTFRSAVLYHLPFPVPNRVAASRD